MRQHPHRKVFSRSNRIDLRPLSTANAARFLSGFPQCTVCPNSTTKTFKSGSGWLMAVQEATGYPDQFVESILSNLYFVGRCLMGVPKLSFGSDAFNCMRGAPLSAKSTIRFSLALLNTEPLLHLVHPLAMNV